MIKVIIIILLLINISIGFRASKSKKIIKKLEDKFYKIKNDFLKYFEEREKKENLFVKHILKPMSLQLNEELIYLNNTVIIDEKYIEHIKTQIDNMIEGAILYPNLYEGMEEEYERLLLMKDKLM
jgi:hypothetical protein